MGHIAGTMFPSPLAERVQSLVCLLWPLPFLSAWASQSHQNGEKITVAAFGQRKIWQGNGASHLSEKFPLEILRQLKVKERTVVFWGSKGAEWGRGTIFSC